MDLLRLQTRVVDQLHYEKVRGKLFFSKQKLFEYGERAGKLLAYLVHSEDRPPVVISLHGPGAGQITDPPSVTSQFRDFFEGLYTSMALDKRETMQLFLTGIPFPQLKEDQVAMLEAPLTTDEMTTAIGSFARSKSPGTDRIPIEFYSQYSEILTPKLLVLYNHLFETFTLPPSMREAIIVLILKPGKDPGYPETYRPISLLQVDFKILAKILALRFNQVIRSILGNCLLTYKLHMLMSVNEWW